MTDQELTASARYDPINNDSELTAEFPQPLADDNQGITSEGSNIPEILRRHNITENRRPNLRLYKIENDSTLAYEIKIKQ